MRLYYSADYVLAAHSFDTTRKAGWIAESLLIDPIAGVDLVEPEPLTEAELLTVHDLRYVAAVRDGEPRRLAESNGFTWDPGLWTMVRASNGGAVRAALDALASGGIAGSLSSGLHHAKHGHGDGFCTFNGLALATRAALAAGASRVLIIDLDAHCGGGTFEILGGEATVHQLDLAVSRYDWYAGNARMRLDVVSDAALYLPTLRQRLSELDDLPFALVLYNAGMDPFEGCLVGGMPGMTFDLLAERETTVFDWCRALREEALLRPALELSVSHRSVALPGRPPAPSSAPPESSPDRRQSRLSPPRVPARVARRRRRRPRAVTESHVYPDLGPPGPPFGRRS